MKSQLMALALSLVFGTSGLAFAQNPTDSQSLPRSVQVERLTETYNAVQSMSEAEFKSLFTVMAAREQAAGRYAQAEALRKTEAKITKSDFLKQLNTHIQDTSTNGIIDATRACHYDGIGSAIQCFFGIIFTILTFDGGEATSNF
jgi:hypothetical protein